MMGQSDELNRVINVVRELLKRPSLIDAIMNRDGYITRDSLMAAAALPGNSSPSEFSQDPFHAQDNDCVVQALKNLFEQLRDPTKDRTFLFEPYQYLAIETLMKVMQDPYDVDHDGVPMLESSTGMPKPKYSELCVYTAKNIIERPGLLLSLERVNSPRLFGPPHHAGYLSNKSLDLWRERYKGRKAR
ncbi:hypothetical protein cym2001_21960 [Pseudomonas sp. CYM-20-01]|jgi:hypothetical protein|uniref:type III secretion effector protein n=1 Tax=Pseudomonas sp. CYM-20-01 TaxID=2870750 RepID=UPI00205B3938|nr:type III secretion effector protein [Pseudomonas sp. CYM-20-01]BDB18831.1 hypothetical protein cym2001_21960 [Pseudomonas sp. CYM-20-01]